MVSFGQDGIPSEALDLSANFALDLPWPGSLDSGTIAVRRYVLIALDIETESSTEGRLGK